MMQKGLYISMLFLNLFICAAQEKNVYSVFFDFDKYTVRESEISKIVKFIEDTDLEKVKDIEIFGYCDDIGSDDYNFKLSNKRANFIKKTLIDKGVENNIIITIEGRGRIIIKDSIKDTTKDEILEIRQKNRRVDVFLKNKIINYVKLPNVYTDLNHDLVEGDRIIFKKIHFEQGKSRLSRKARIELKRIAKKIKEIIKENENFSFEIHGHICCTPKRYKDAIDKDTKKRELSTNRARKIYDFFIEQNIDEKRMNYLGCGSEYSLKSKPYLDRRVEILITSF